MATMCQNLTLNGMTSFPDEPGLSAVTTEPWKLASVESTCPSCQWGKDHGWLQRCTFIQGHTWNKKHPEWVQIEHTLLSALKFPFHEGLPGRGPVFYQWGMAWGSCHMQPWQWALGVWCRQTACGGKSLGWHLRRGSWQPPDTILQISNKYVKSPCTSMERRALHIYILCTRFKNQL